MSTTTRRDNLQAEITELEAMLSEMSSLRFIERIGLQHWLDGARAALLRLPADALAYIENREQQDPELAEAVRVELDKLRFTRDALASPEERSHIIRTQWARTLELLK